MAMSSSFFPKTYDVFISFRGEDTRNGFTSHLHHALCEKGIKAYIDDPDLPKGDTVWDALCKAIHDSHIAIIVFSTNYASSKWCLDEVVEILKCRQSEGQVFIPVFYGVDPSHIRNQSGSYGKAFSKYDSMGENIRNKVPQWKDALTKAANLSGWDSRTYGNESQFIKNIVENVSGNLFKMYPQKSKDKGLVGMYKICEKVQQLLSKKKQEQLHKNVKVIGIWGMGGIGKTTIANVLFYRLLTLYDNAYFFENIRESSENGTASKLKALSDTLLSQLLKDENLKFNPSGSTFIERRLSSKKVLIILDDVDSFDQLENFREVYSYAGPESTVILTTRNRHLLVGEVDEIYEAERLSFDESLELFCLHAFKQRCPQKGYEELSKAAVHYAGGVPLALKVLGSNLYSRNTEFWECELRKVKNYPHKDIDNVLRVSYDGLDISQKKIFLDIAFYFKGECKGSVERILNACDFFATSGLQVLEDKALITVSNDTIQMHDLIQEMGLNIVSEGIEDPEKRSRLTAGEIYDVLAKKKGSDAVEAIILNLSHIDDLLHLHADSFSMMSNLRILRLYTRGGTGSSKVIYPRVFNKISDNLRYLEWHGYSLKSLPANFRAEMLVEIHMQDSHVTELWQGEQKVVNLKVIDLEGCKHLIRLPDLSASKLKEVNLVNCECLLAVDQSILCLDTLQDLFLDGCIKLEHLICNKHSRSLETISFICCPSLKEFSISSNKIVELAFWSGVEKLNPSLGNMPRLTWLHIDGSRLTNFPCFRLGVSLDYLGIKNCRVVMDKQNLHVLLEGLTHLRRLELRNCSKMSELPDNISGLSDLDVLILDGSRVEQLPESIKHLSKLSYLGLRNCKMLCSLPELPPNLTSLNVYNCIKLKRIPELPPNLRRLNVYNCIKLKRIPELPPILKELNVGNCIMLKRIPELPPQLEELMACNCYLLPSVTLSTSKVLAVMPRSSHINSWPGIYIKMYLENCEELDRHSFMESTLLAMMYILFHYKYGEVRKYNWRVCFPESEVPTQFKYRTKGSSLTITLPPEPLLGIIFCVVISPSMIFKNQEAVIDCRYDLPDGIWKRYQVSTGYRPSINLHLDHAYIWCDTSYDFPFPLDQHQQLSLKFSCNLLDVKECGVHPVPMSEDVHRLIRGLGLYSSYIELDPDVAQRAEQSRDCTQSGIELSNNSDYCSFILDSESHHSETLTVIETSDDEKECNDQNNQHSDSDDDWLLCSDSESLSSDIVNLHMI